MNQLVLLAQLQERGALRYTPAGLPALELLLKSDTQVSEDGSQRQVQLEIKALAIGGICHRLQDLSLGHSGLWSGFLAPSRNRKGLVFHITELS